MTTTSYMTKEAQQFLVNERLEAFKAHATPEWLAKYAAYDLIITAAAGTPRLLCTINGLSVSIGPSSSDWPDQMIGINIEGFTIPLHAATLDAAMQLAIEKANRRAIEIGERLAQHRQLQQTVEAAYEAALATIPPFPAERTFPVFEIRWAMAEGSRVAWSLSPDLGIFFAQGQRLEWFYQCLPDNRHKETWYIRPWGATITARFVRSWADLPASLKELGEYMVHDVDFHGETQQYVARPGYTFRRVAGEGPLPAVLPILIEQV